MRNSALFIGSWIVAGIAIVAAVIIIVTPSGKDQTKVAMQYANNDAVRAQAEYKYAENDGVRANTEAVVAPAQVANERYKMDLDAQQKRDELQLAKNFENVLWNILYVCGAGVMLSFISGLIRRRQ